MPNPHVHVFRSIGEIIFGRITPYAGNRFSKTILAHSDSIIFNDERYAVRGSVGRDGNGSFSALAPQYPVMDGILDDRLQSDWLNLMILSMGLRCSKRS